MRKFENAIIEKMKIYEAIDPATGKEKVVNTPAGTAPQAPAPGTSAPSAPAATTAPTGGTATPSPAPATGGTTPASTSPATPNATPQAQVSKTDFTKIVNVQNLPDLLKYLTTDPNLSKGLSDYVAKNQAKPAAQPAVATPPAGNTQTGA